MKSNEEIRNQHISDLKKIQEAKEKQEEELKDKESGKYIIRG